MTTIAVIGAGVVGSAIARELTRYRVRVVVLEREPDAAYGTSGRNSGVLHAGFNNVPGSKMARMCVEGNRGFDALAKDLDIRYKRTGKLVVGFDEDDRRVLTGMLSRGRENGCMLEMIPRAEIDRLAPKVRGEFAMYSPLTAILDPFEYTFALMENAVRNGARFLFNSPVMLISTSDGEYTLHTPTGDVRADFIVNAAGHGAAALARTLGLPEIETYPCRGEYYVLDKRVGDTLPLPAYPVPNPRAGGLGIHLTPTVDSNVLIGPSNEYTSDADDRATTAPVLEELLRDGEKLLPGLSRGQVIRTFAGVRPKLTNRGGYHDFVIERSGRAVNLVGIESPGLTAAMPIARYVTELLGEVTELTPRADFDPYRKAFPRFRDLPDEVRRELVRENPAFGEIVCRCETVTYAEVLDAVRRGARTVIGVKNRCRASMGRCQGGYCGSRIAQILHSELGLPYEEILYHMEGSWMFLPHTEGAADES